MPQDPNNMYRWRQWSEDQRESILAERVHRNHPIHSPAHIKAEHTSIYLITAACFEHAPIIGTTHSRMDEFTNQLCEVVFEHSRQVYAWVVLPNHYHFLSDICELTSMFHALARLHGRSSFEWNGVDVRRGRQVWCKAAETAMKSEGHFYASRNYVLNNPVHHGYCKKWTDWPYSNAAEYLEALGRDEAIRYWNSYPLYDFGSDWDPASL